MRKRIDGRRVGGETGHPRRRTVRTALGALLLAGTIAVSGCGSAGGGSDASGLSAERSQADAPAAQRGRAEDRGAAPKDAGSSHAADTAGTAEDAERHVVRTATLTVETEDVAAASDEARTAVEAAGGHVARETTDRDDDGEERSRITFEVPPEEYPGVLEALAGVGELVERKSSAKDVTGDVVDVESRIRTQKASVARIRELMDDATELSDVVTLESELSRRQADLEALQARLESLQARSGMATVTLELRTPEAGPVDEDEDPTVGGAVSGGWDAFVTMLRWIAVGIGAALPFLAALALLYGVWRAVRGRLRVPQRAVASPAAPLSKSTADEDR